MYQFFHKCVVSNDQRKASCDSRSNLQYLPRLCRRDPTSRKPYQLIPGFSCGAPTVAKSTPPQSACTRDLYSRRLVPR